MTGLVDGGTDLVHDRVSVRTAYGLARRGFLDPSLFRMGNLWVPTDEGVAWINELRRDRP